MPDRLSIYLDYAAATPLDERIFSVMQPYLTEKYYNPSAIYRQARQAKADFESARSTIAKVLGVKPHEIIFTAGGTESINLAIIGIAGRYGGSVAVSSIEHEAVLAAAEAVGNYQLVEPDQQGYISAQAVKEVISDDTTLVSIGYVNNELGTVQPIKDIAAIIQLERERRLKVGNKRPIFFHSDASQAPGLLDISISRLGVDLMTLNASKCYGPKQVGLLWRRPTVELSPIIHGGGQEQSLRSGTENVAGVIGFAEALQISDKSRKTESYRIGQLRDKLQDTLQAGIDGVVINGHLKRRSPHILHISVPNLDGERAVYGLDEEGVMAATGSACAANRHTRSHVLQAVGMTDELADGSLRFSLGRWTTDEEIEQAGRLVCEVVERERGL